MASLRRSRQSVNFWPGYVDGLAGLLMMVMFLLMFYVLGELHLSAALNDSQQETEHKSGVIQELLSQLSVSESDSQSLAQQVESLRGDINNLLLQQEDNRNTISLLQRNILASNQEKEELSLSLEGLRAEFDSTVQQNSILQDDLTTRETSLAEAEKIQNTQLKTIAQLQKDIVALQTLRDSLQDSAARQDARLTEQDRELIQSRADVKQLGEQIAFLNQSLSDLRRLLDVQTQQINEKDIQISDLGSRLNVALASELSRLQRYKSEFMGKMRALLTDEKTIKIADERFVFQSEVLFPSSSDELSEGGKRQLERIAKVIKQLAQDAPDTLPWVLRVDGHTDTRPINTPRFPSNWELSTSRAIAVVKFLIDQGIPENRLAATGFGASHPIESRNDEIAHRRNRRIELQITQR